MNRTIGILYFTLLGVLLHGQSFQADTLLFMEIPEYTITATRNQRSIHNVAVPVSIISAKNIQLTGLTRLHEILQEQTGLALTGGTGSGAVGGGIFGNGIQIQGLSPEYTLILLDGEPITGRQGGVLDLSRFTVGNIRKIEIVKGPSSALYGSEAMGGVVHILTDHQRKNAYEGYVRAGSFGAIDLSNGFHLTKGKTDIYLFGQFNRSQGYDLNKATPEKTLDPFFNQTYQARVIHNVTERSKWVLQSRYFRGNQSSAFAINNNEINVNGSGITSDLQINPSYQYIFNDKLKTAFRGYASLYDYSQNLKKIETSESFYDDYFRHLFMRVENQTDWQWHSNQTLIAGGGYNIQQVETNRYKGVKTQYIGYFFFQNEWQPSKKWTVIPGLRYDMNSDYSNRWSPKMALRFAPDHKWTWMFSYGSGFKAPDFRQLYLYYVNQAALGYKIYGASEFSIDELIRQKNEGLISRIYPEAYQIRKLNPEFSHAVNMGFRYQPDSRKWRSELNIFYNDINDLIQYFPVAMQTNGSLIFSYKNISQAFTAGVEINGSRQISGSLEISAGYQWLASGDWSIINQLREGTIYGRNTPTGSTRVMKTLEYTGLMGRSPHMANIKISGNHNHGISWSVRAIYQSKKGLLDLDGNGFANMAEEFTKPYFQLNASVQKQWKKDFTWQCTLNNMTNHIDEVSLPQIPGRHFSTAILWNITY